MCKYDFVCLFLTGCGDGELAPSRAACRDAVLMGDGGDGAGCSRRHHPLRTLQDSQTRGAGCRSAFLTHVSAGSVHINLIVGHYGNL